MSIASIGAGDRANQAVTTPEAGECPDQILKKILNPKYIAKIWFNTKTWLTLKYEMNLQYKVGGAFAQDDLITWIPEYFGTWIPYYLNTLLHEYLNTLVPEYVPSWCQE